MMNGAPVEMGSLDWTPDITSILIGVVLVALILWKKRPNSGQPQKT